MKMTSLLFGPIGKNLLNTLKVPAFKVSLYRTMTTKKFSGYRTKCASNEPRCGEIKTKEKKEKGDCPEHDKVKQTAMWLNPECCLDLCPNAYPRFDDLYYKPSDKSKRKYARTWNECPEIRIVPKKICCYEHIEYPPMERRKKSARPETACPIVSEEEQKSCALVGNKRCIKLRLPGCGPVRDPPKCFIVRKPTNCQKICTPYPSYSECNRPKPKIRHPVECNCLYVGPLCAIK